MWSKNEYEEGDMDDDFNPYVVEEEDSVTSLSNKDHLSALKLGIGIQEQRTPTEIAPQPVLFSSFCAPAPPKT